MNFSGASGAAGEYAEFHDELRAVAAEILAKDIDWPLLVQAGWVGLDVPEEFGGAGATMAEIAVICEELGRAAAATAYLGGAVLATGALQMVAPTTLLNEVVDGTTRVALALSGDTTAAPFELATTRLGWRVYGRAAFVPDAVGAQRILLPGVDPEGIPVLVDVASDAVGFAVEPQPVLDETRDLATVSFSLAVSS